MAAQVALSARVRELILTHFSPRYAPGNAIGLEDLLQTAKAIFPGSRMAHDFMTYEIPRRVDR
jgi:ribonuclease Z